MLPFRKSKNPASAPSAFTLQALVDKSGLWRGKQKNNKAIKQNLGFSLPELLVSLGIITLIMLVVMPNFRAGQKSQEIDVNLKQVIEGITSVRTKSLAGQLLINGAWPAGTTTDGYGIRFDLTKPKQYELFALLPDYVPERKVSLPAGLEKIGSIEIVSLHGLADPEKDKPFEVDLAKSPWQNINTGLEGVFLEIIFSLPDEIAAAVIKADQTEAENNFKYVGGIIKHVKSGRQGYFYVSLLSGAVNYGLY